MTTLALLLPARERHADRAAAADALPASWSYVLSADGSSVTQAGSAAVPQLPKADTVVLVLADAEVSWHRLDIPKAAPARLRAALVGALEEALLDDEEALHFALAPASRPGAAGWVAVTNRPRLQAALAVLDAVAGGVQRVVVASLPAAPVAPPAGQATLGAADAEARGHFHWPDAGRAAAGSPWLSHVSAERSLTLSLAGGLCRAWLGSVAGTRWTASPGTAAAAEAWLAQAVPVMTDAERALEAVAAADGRLDLRQFDLAPRHRGLRALREGWLRLQAPAWRPVRWGLAALLALQIVGLNVSAWQQRQALQARRDAQVAMLKASHPGVRAVLDAALQMQRETELLRAAAGRPGPGDFEGLLSAAAAAWPDGLGPAASLAFEPGRLSLAAQGWTEPQVSQFRERLKAQACRAEFDTGRVAISCGSSQRAGASNGLRSSSGSGSGSSLVTQARMTDVAPTGADPGGASALLLR